MPRLPAAAAPGSGRPATSPASSASSTARPPPAARPTERRLFEPRKGDTWSARGGAAVASAPPSSMGIGYALASGTQAARLAAGAVSGHDPQLPLYAEDVAGHYTSYLARKRDYYE